MSGLEPIAALGLACNILQVVGVGLKTVQIAKQVYADGELDPSLTDSATVLNTLCRQICSATATAPSTRRPTAQERQLLELAQKCQDAARDLREEVAFLNGQGSKTKLVATLRIAAKTTWRKRRLEKLSQKLKDIERLLQTGLLSRIYEQSVRTNNELSTLDARLRAFIHEYRNGHASAIDLVRHTMAENKKSEATVMSHITHTSQQSEASLKGYIGSAIREVDKKDQDALLEAKRGRLLRSLKFDRMNERRNQVVSSHTKTLSWVLQDGSDSNGPQDTEDVHQTNSDSTWDSFSDWLRSTETVYWISGKPGSGKTTLIKYLLGRDETREFLDLWKSNALIVSHFFWRPGTSMQQSIRGLLCSLLHQLLLGEPAASDEVFRINRDASNKDTETDWPYEELRNAFHHVLSRYPRPLAMFLDGLDEVLPQDGVLKLLETVEEVKDRQSGKIKLCLGSRREPLLLKRLGIYPRLRLEQLNLADLRQYAEDHVVIPDDYHITPCDLCSLSGTPLKEWLVNSLTSRAEGVFLWLCLTATTIQKALNEGESVQDIRHRIGSLPRDLSDLFADMWARANNDRVNFQKRAASFLQLALAGIGETEHNYPLNPFVMMVATTPEMPRLLLEPSQRQHISVSSLVEACKATIRETASRCAGLLVLPSLKEVGEVEDTYLFPWHREEYNLLLPYVSKSPEYFFLHRTARDFLTDTEGGKRILKESNFTRRHAKLKLLEARLAIHRLFRSPVHYTSKDSDVSFFNNQRNYLRDVLKNMVSAIKTNDGEFERAEITRLLLVCEQLFHNGYLSSPSMVPLPSSEFALESRRPEICTSYEATVKLKHEFLLWAAFYAIDFPDIWNYLSPMIHGRSFDQDTALQLLIHACSFSNPQRSSSQAMESRSKTIHALLRRLGTPCLVGLHRRVSGDYYPGPWLATFETPFKALIMSLWITAISFNPEPNHSRRLLELVIPFVAHGANLKEEVHVAIELDGDRIRILPINPFEWTGLSETRTRSSSCGTGHAFLLVSYPATAVLTHILNLWKLTDHLGFEWVPKVPEKGIPVAIVGLDMKVIPGSRWMFEMEEIYPLEPETEAAGNFQHLIRLAEDGLMGPILRHTSGNYVFGATLASVTASREIHEMLEGAFKVLRSGNVPLAERRRAVRMKLGIQTPLEEPEWRSEDEIFRKYMAT